MPPPSDIPLDDPEELRRRAEERAAEWSRSEAAPLPEDLPKLVHELRVHQVELEMQNEALRSAQLELEISRDRYADLYDSAPVGYLTLDADGVIEEINLTACRMFHAERPRLLGAPLLSYVVSADKNAFVRHLSRCRAAAQDRTLSASLTLRAQGGDEFPAELWTTRTVDSHPEKQRWLTVVHDLTEQRRVADELRESEWRLRLALEAGQMGLWQWNLGSGTSIWNEREFELLGMAPREGPVDNRLLFDRVHPEDRGEMERRLAEAINGSGDYTNEFRIVRDDGEIRWLKGYGRVLRDHEGRAKSMVGVNFDITEGKEIAVELEAVNRNLEEEVAERTSALALLRDVAAVSNRAQNVESALKYCLKRVSEHNGWSFGHAFLPAEEDPELLLPAYVWYCTDAERFEAFRELTLKRNFRRGEGLPGRVFEKGEAEWGTRLEEELEPERFEMAERLDLKTAAAFPILVERRTVGVLEFFSGKAIEPTRRLTESMASIGTQLGRVVERKQFQARLLTIADEQQRRLGQELHDDVGQEITGLALKAETLAENLAEEESRWSDFAAGMVEGLNRVQQKTRTLAHGLIPMDIEAPILEAALEELALRTDAAGGVACSFRLSGEQRVADGQTATQLLRIAQEAVANALQHAGASEVEIELKTGKSTILAVRDDGRGLPEGGGSPDGMGLQIMLHRAALIGATLTAESLAEGGTQVTCRVARRRFD